MARRRPTRKKPTRAGRRAEPTIWIGARVEAPFYVADPEPHRPDVAVWMELPTGRLLATHVGPTPMSPEAAVAALPAVAGALPDGICVDAELAEAVAARFGAGVNVVVGDASEIEDALTEVVDAMPVPPGGPPPSYLEDGRVPEAAVRALFDAAAALHRVAPWTMAVEEQAIAVDVPALDLYDGCLVVIGAMGESFGFLLFESLGAHDAFAADVDDGGAPDLSGFMLSLNFEPRDALPAPMLRQIAAHGWQVAGDRGYPLVLCLDDDGVRRPTAPADVALATVCAEALVQFFQRHGDTLRARHPVTVTEELTRPDGIQVRLRVPHPRALRLEPDAECACGSGRTFGGCHLRDDPASPLRAYRRADYAGWLDRPIRALKGRTPRQAVRTPGGRETVRELLGVLAALEREFPAAERVDLAPLSAVLGVDD